MKKIVIIGSKGFIGRSIVDYLSTDPTFVVMGIDLPELDLRDNSQVESKLPDILKDSKVIMAASITRDRDNSIQAMLDNIKMDSNIANILSNCSATHFIYLSSIDVYGRENLSLPLHELSKVVPWNYYAISKITGEYIFKIACQSGQIPLTVLRLPGVYGPGDTHRSPIKIFITNALNRRTITIQGTGSEKRDFIYIKDISAIVRQVISNKISGTFNIVTGRSYTIDEILSIINKLCNYSLDIVHGDVSGGVDLVFKKSALLDMIPMLSFTELEIGLKKTYGYYKKNNTINNWIRIKNFPRDIRPQ